MPARVTVAMPNTERSQLGMLLEAPPGPEDETVVRGVALRCGPQIREFAARLGCRFCPSATLVKTGMRLFRI